MPRSRTEALAGLRRSLRTTLTDLDRFRSECGEWLERPDEELLDELKEALWPVDRRLDEISRELELTHAVTATAAQAGRTPGGFA